MLRRGLVNSSPNLPTAVPSLTDLEAASAHLDVIDKEGVGQAKKIVLSLSRQVHLFVPFIMPKSYFEQTVGRHLQQG